MHACWFVRLIAFFMFLGLTSCGSPSSTANPTPDPKVETKTTLTIPTGGTIEFPETSLPTDAKVQIEAAELPILPLGAEALGEATSIEFSKRASRLVTLKLPVPEGKNADDLAVFQVQSDGTTVLLSSEVIENELVAMTNVFSNTTASAFEAQQIDDLLGAASQFVSAELESLLPPEIQDLSPPRKGTVAGPAVIEPGQVAMYSLVGFEEALPQSMTLEWSLYGGSAKSLEGTETNLKSFLIEANEVGSLDLGVAYVDPRSGTRGFASKLISVQEPLEADAASLNISVIDGNPERIVNTSEAGFLIGIVNSNADSVSYSWNYGDGSASGVGTSSNTDASKSFGFRLPAHSFDNQGKFTLSITANDSDGRTGILELPINVRAEKLELFVTGANNFKAHSSPFSRENYTATIVNGTAPFSLIWSLRGRESGEVTTSKQTEVLEIFAKEPGSYHLTTKVKDAKGETAVFTRPISVTGGQPLSIMTSLDKAVIQPDQSTVLSYQVTGGILTSNSKLQPYKVSIDWGDEETSLIIDASSTQQSYEGSALHTYETEGSYLVRAYVTDATGKRIAAEALQVEVIGCSGEILSDQQSCEIPAPIVNRFSATPLRGDAPLEVQFSWSVNDAAGSILNCSLNTGIEVLEFSPCPAGIPYEYSKAGTYLATLTVSNLVRETVSAALTIEVAEKINTVTVSGVNFNETVIGIPEGLTLNTALTLSGSFIDGELSGTLAGIGSYDKDFPCFFPDEPDVILDTATVRYTETYGSSFATGLPIDGGDFSAAISPAGNTSFKLIVPFDQEDCVGLNDNPAPGIGPWNGSGTISGTVLADGSVSVETSWTSEGISVGGSWQGQGVVE